MYSERRDILYLASSFINSDVSPFNDNQENKIHIPKNKTKIEIQTPNSNAIENGEIRVGTVQNPSSNKMAFH